MANRIANGDRVALDAIKKVYGLVSDNQAISFSLRIAVSLLAQPLRVRVLEPGASKIGVEVNENLVAEVGEQNVLQSASAYEDLVLAPAGLEGKGNVGEEPAAAVARQASLERMSLIELVQECERADDSNNRKAKIAALQEVWARAFPVSRYEYSQLSESFALWLTRDNRSAAWTAQVIMRVGEKQADRDIEFLISYMKTVFVEEEAREKKRQDKVANRELPTDNEDIMPLMRQIARSWGSQDSTQGERETSGV